MGRPAARPRRGLVVRQAAAVVVLAFVGVVAATSQPVRGAPHPAQRAASPSRAPPRVFAFVSRVGGAELGHVRAFGRRIDVLAPNWFALDIASGRVAGGGPHHAALRRAARAAGSELWPVVNARTGGSPLVLDVPWRERVARRVAAIAAHGDYAGMTLDVEGIAPDQAPAYTALVTAVAARLHAHERRLAVYVPRPFTTFGAGYDWPGLAGQADLLLASGYNESRAGTAPGPISTSAGFAAVLQNAASVSHSRVAPTIGAFGYRWPQAGGPGTLLSTRAASRLRVRCHAPFTIHDGSVSFACGQDNVVYESESGLVMLARASRRAGFRWLALYSLGREPAGFWHRIA